MHETINLTADLNPAQKEAAETLNGPLLILAGAGSGKTRVLTCRVANLILQGEATPGQILAVTFTNKAAKEMGHRIEKLLMASGIPFYEPPWISTFHSSCARILRDEIHHLGYQPFFVIYDDGDQLSLVKKIVDDLNLNDKIFPPKGIRHQISQAKMLGLTPETVSKNAFLKLDQVTLDVFRIYEEEMKRANALDFDDLLLKTYQLFRDHPDVLETYREKFQYIMVDEYQDTNHIQYLLIKLLAEIHRNLCVVGDEDQSIYSWRGADIRNILDFEKDFPEAKVVKLEENYRSTKNIVEAASFVVRNNSQRKDKTLFTHNQMGSKIVIQTENNEYDEGRFVVRKMQELHGYYKYNDIAVFYRTNAQSRVIEEQLRSYAIPYRMIGSVKFYERKEVKDIICYLRLVLNPMDDVAFYRVVNTPTRGIGKTTLDEVLKLSTAEKIPALEAAEQVAQRRLVHAGACTKLQNFKYLIDKMRNQARGTSTSDLYLKILDDTGYALKLREENTPEAEGRLENLEEFQNAILQFEKERGEEASLQSFLEEMALISDADKDQGDVDAVTLMTLHLSKGLEYPNVFIVGMEEGLFPSSKSTEELDPDKLEEERRLAYVGMTRARENLFLSCARSRRVYGQEEHRPPSRFLSEIPSQYVTTNAELRRSSSFSGFKDRHSGSAGSYGKKSDSFSKYSDNSPAEHSSSYTSGKYALSRKGSGNSDSSEPQEFPDYEEFSESSFAQSPSTYKKGDRVRHPNFGVGSIFQVEGSGDQQKVSVLFTDKSLRKFMVKHARLDKV